MSDLLVIRIGRLVRSVVVNFVGLLDHLGSLIQATRFQSHLIVLAHGGGFLSAGCIMWAYRSTVACRAALLFFVQSKRVNVASVRSLRR